MNVVKKRHRLAVVVWIVGGLVVLGLVTRFALVKPYEIPSNSMEPTLAPGDRVLVNKLSYKFWAPNRGDVVVFQYPKDPDRVFIKRVIGLEGEKVEIKDSKVLINDQPVNEPYLNEGQFPPFPPQVIPQGQILVLGDNRNKSKDSRDWGLLPKQYLLGKAFYIYWPGNRRQLIQ